MERPKSTIATTSNNLSVAYSLQSIAYLLALAVAIFVGSAYRHLHPIWYIGLADLAGTFVIFIFSRSFNNSSFYDPYWSLGPIFIAWSLLPIGGANWSLINLLTLILITFWGVRLTYNFFRGWKGLKQQDWRYDNLATKTGKWYWLVSFSGIHLFPTIMVYGGCLPLFALFLFPQAGNNLEWISIFGLIIGFVSVFIEAKADQQLHTFVKNNHDPTAFLTKGLWGICRHPNYLGEVGFWWGLYLIGLSANPDWWWTFIGPLAINLMFVFISIPMIDKRMVRKRPDYAMHMKKLRAIVPRFK